MLITQILIKNLLKNLNTSYKEGKKIENNRKDLANKITYTKKLRDRARAGEKNSELDYPNSGPSMKQMANSNDNSARAYSQIGKALHLSHAKEFENFPNKKIDDVAESLQRKSNVKII